MKVRLQSTRVWCHHRVNQMSHSDEEPAAIRYVPNAVTSRSSLDWVPTTAKTRDASPVRATRYNSAALARDLSGAHAADFDTYEFVRKLLGDVGELDGNAALVALDGVEHMLRKRRKLAARDVTVAKEELRHALRGAVRLREESIDMANTANKRHIRIDGKSRTATMKLNSAVETLTQVVNERVRLGEARDVVRLLGSENIEMDDVRATEILALLRAERRKGTFAQVLSDELNKEANQRLDHFEREMAMRISERVTMDEPSESEGVDDVEYPI